MQIDLYRYRSAPRLAFLSRRDERHRKGPDTVARYKSRLRNITVDVARTRDMDHGAEDVPKRALSSVCYRNFCEISRADSAYGCYTFHRDSAGCRCVLSGHKSTDISSFRALRSTNERNFNGTLWKRYRISFHCFVISRSISDGYIFGK